MLEIRNLVITVGSHEIVNLEELDLPAGQRLGLVGESGSGKTMTTMGILGLLPTNVEMTGSVKFQGRELVGLSDLEMASTRGIDIGVVFQDPARALNPMMRVGRQVSEVLRIHTDLSKFEIDGEVIALLSKVHLADPETLLRRYPHQLSGGQQQRVLIAIAIACSPRLIIADEPTTALDVTVQEGILELLVELSEERGIGLLFVSHDLGVVRSVSQEIAVMYGGHLVEVGSADDLIDNPRHRYTSALIAANPGLPDPARIEVYLGRRLETISGSVPPLGGFPEGCRFRGRCPFEIDRCVEAPTITLIGHNHRFKCWNPREELTNVAIG